MKNLTQQFIIYKVAILIGVLFSINSLSTALVASFANAEWATLSPTSKFLLIVVVLQNWTGTMLAFLNKTISRVEKGQFPLDTSLGTSTGDTNAQAFVKTTTETTVKQPATAIIK